MKSTEDFYATLRVDASADSYRIRTAYRRLALKYHPDRNHSPGATKAMQRVNLAYEVLRDPVRRRDYDRARAVTKISQPDPCRGQSRRPGAGPNPKKSASEAPVGEGRDSGGSEWIFVLILIPTIVKAIQRWAA